MDPAQTKNRHALQGVLAMLKGAKSTAQTVQVISLALQTEGLYTFGELSKDPAVQALNTTDQRSWLEVLQIFQHGTYRDYAQKEAQFTSGGMTLNKKQRAKLRASTFVVLGQNPPITFDSACSALGIDSRNQADGILEMSRCFVDAVDEGLVSGRLDSQARKIHIDKIAPLRDVSTAEYAEMLHVVNRWIENTDRELRSMDEHGRAIRLEAESKRTEEEEFEQRKEAADLEISKGRKRGAGGSGDGADDYAAGASGSRNTRAR